MNDRIEKSIEIKAPVSRVWRALTDHREFGAWFGVRLEGPFAVGKTAAGDKTNPCSGKARFEAVVQKMEPERLFSFTWRPYAADSKEDYSKEPPTLVEFTLLRVVESGFERISAKRRAEAFPMHERGWSQQIENIETHVGQTP